jgi:hypothetical protein
MNPDSGLRDCTLLWIMLELKCSYTESAATEGAIKNGSRCVDRARFGQPDVIRAKRSIDRRGALVSPSPFSYLGRYVGE